MTETVRVTKTIPCPTQPPPCLDDDNRIQARQQTFPAVINAKITYTDRNKKRQPLRFVSVNALGIVSSSTNYTIGQLKATATLNINGEAQFRFRLNTGESIHVDRLETKLEGKSYRIGTRKTAKDKFSTKWVGLRLTVNPWQVKSGETKAFTNNHPYSAYNQALWVAEAYQTITDFTKSKVIGSQSLEKVIVWYPTPVAGTFFYPSSADPHINLPDEDAQDPDVMAHEFGHFIHFLARNKVAYHGGGSHTSCGQTTPRNERTSFSEGFATAFGLAALDLTPLQNKRYGGYSDVLPDGSEAIFRDFELYSCSEQVLTLQEGRITAAIFDLFDRKLETFPTANSDLGRIRNGFTAQGLNARFDVTVAVLDNHEE